ARGTLSGTRLGDGAFVPPFAGGRRRRRPDHLAAPCREPRPDPRAGTPRRMARDDRSTRGTAPPPPARARARERRGGSLRVARRRLARGCPPHRGARHGTLARVRAAERALPDPPPP